MKSRSQFLFPFSLVLAAVVYGLTIYSPGLAVRERVNPELLVKLPRAAQVLVAGGDRYLAANLSGFRVLVATTARMRAEDYAVQAALQQDVSWLNPAHEDNYYIASAILPWNGHVDDSQQILQRASDKRTFDWQPLFYLGFGYYHFKKDPAKAAEQLLKAVPRAKDAQDELALQNLATRWIDRGYDLRTAASMVKGMANNSREGAFKRYLNKRSARMVAVADLRQAVERYQERFHQPPAKLADLVSAGVLRAIPEDPMGVGFALDANGAVR